MEMCGFPDAAKDQIFKLASINLCPNISGQITTTLMMNPPKIGEPSYELYIKASPGLLLHQCAVFGCRCVPLVCIPKAQLQPKPPSTPAVHFFPLEFLPCCSKVKS